MCVCFQLNITRLPKPYPSKCWDLTRAQAATYSVYSEHYDVQYSLTVRLRNSNSNSRVCTYETRACPADFVCMLPNGTRDQRTTVHSLVVLTNTLCRHTCLSVFTLKFSLFSLSLGTYQRILISE